MLVTLATASENDVYSGSNERAKRDQVNCIKRERSGTSCRVLIFRGGRAIQWLDMKLSGRMRAWLVFASTQVLLLRRDT